MSLEINFLLQNGICTHINSCKIEKDVKFTQYQLS